MVWSAEGEARSPAIPHQPDRSGGTTKRMGSSPGLFLKRQASAASLRRNHARLTDSRSDRAKATARKHTGLSDTLPVSMTTTSRIPLYSNIIINGYVKSMRWTPHRFDPCQTRGRRRAWRPPWPSAASGFRRPPIRSSSRQGRR